jgi:hypothetical protein
MTDGDSLESASRAMDINPGTVLGWIMASSEGAMAYENTKVPRARAFIERAIDEMQTNPDFKAGESRARTYMRLAALLNPTEFSDKMHVNIGKGGSSKQVSFTLIMGGQAQDKGELTVIAQPEGEGE